VIFKPIDALSVLSAQLTRDLLAIAKFLFNIGYINLVSVTHEISVLSFHDIVSYYSDFLTAI